MDLFDREKARVKKYQFHLFSFILCICSVHFYEYNEPDHLVAANIQVYKKNKQLQIAKVFLIPLVIFIFIIMITVTIQLKTAFLLLCNY